MTEKRCKGEVVEERQWIHAIQRGNKQYLQDIAERYYDDIFRFCAFQTGSREEAYDLAQETFLRFIRYVEGYHHKNLKGYLLTIAMNLCRDYLAEKSRRETTTEEFDSEDIGAAEDSPERHSVETDIHERLLEALDGLPQMQREALLLHYLQDMKYREIAGITGVTVSTVKSRVKQGTEKLRDCLRKEDFL